MNEWANEISKAGDVAPLADVDHFLASVAEAHGFGCDAMPLEGQDEPTNAGIVEGVRGKDNPVTVAPRRKRSVVHVPHGYGESGKVRGYPGGNEFYSLGVEESPHRSEFVPDDGVGGQRGSGATSFQAVRTPDDVVFEEEPWEASKFPVEVSLGLGRMGDVEHSSPLLGESYATIAQERSDDDLPFFVRDGDGAKVLGPVQGYPESRTWASHPVVPGVPARNIAVGPSWPWTYSALNQITLAVPTGVHLPSVSNTGSEINFPPQRLHADRPSGAMIQSDLHGDMKRMAETTIPARRGE